MKRRLDLRQLGDMPQVEQPIDLRAVQAEAARQLGLSDMIFSYCSVKLDFKRRQHRQGHL